jgi:hypothetical protein
MQATNGWGMKALGAGGDAVLSGSYASWGFWCFEGSLFAERARWSAPAMLPQASAMLASRTSMATAAAHHAIPAW